MAKADRDMLPGTLDLLVLRVLDLEAMHGWGVARRIQERSADVLRVNQGSLYPALKKLEDRGWVRSKLGTTREGRSVKMYELTRAGRLQLETEERSWLRLSEAVNEVLSTG